MFILLSALASTGFLEQHRGLDPIRLAMVRLRDAGELAEFDSSLGPLVYIPVDGELGSFGAFLYLYTEFLNPVFWINK